MTGAVWHGERIADVSDEALRGAVRAATLNRVAAAVTDVYPDRLQEHRRRLAAGRESYRRNLGRVLELLSAAGVAPILIKADADDEYGNFDLVIGAEEWPAALLALGSWTVRRERFWLEADKVICRPASGPAAHLHHHVAWFGVTVIRLEQLRRDARQSADFPCEVPAPADELRVLLAHALFQNLSTDLFELLLMRRLLTGGVAASAQRDARTEGWGEAFSAALRLVTAAMASLDAGRPVRLPVETPVMRAARAGVEHAKHLAAAGAPAMALRELALRGPLIVAKRRRRLWG